MSWEAVDAPKRCDVVVIGGGLAGLLVADRLAPHCSVVQVACAEIPTATESSLSIVGCGAQDSPARLVLGMGEDRASQYWQWSAHSIDLLFERAEQLGVSCRREGSWRVALDDRELREWTASLRFLDRWQADSAGGWRCASEGELDGLGDGFAGAAFMPRDGVVDVAGMASLLAQQLQNTAISITDTAQVLPGCEDDGAKRVELGSGRVLITEMVVIAAGWNSASVDSSLRDMVYPVRLQGLRTEPLGDRLVPQPVLARDRFESWFQEASGELIFAGCRWAEQPEMGAGISDAEDRSEAVLDRQREFIGRHLPWAADVEVREYWSGIAAWSCDGLPLVGTLPGNPRVSVLAGWGGAGLSLVAAAAAAVSDSILGQGLESSPSFLQPRRML